MMSPSLTGCVEGLVGVVVVAVEFVVFLDEIVVVYEPARVLGSRCVEWEIPGKRWH